jgi:hypothetical protein
MDETGVLLTFFVLLNLHFCFLLGYDSIRAEKANKMNGALQAAEKLHRAGKKRQGTTSVVPIRPIE